MKSKFIMSLLWSIMLVGGFTAVYAQGIDQHPELSPEEKLQTCRGCHKEATPDIYNQWYNSRHGLDNVRCFQCHGTFENMKRVPDEAVCSVCHSGEFHKKPAGSSCWQCHPAHAFHAHK